MNSHLSNPVPSGSCPIHQTRRDAVVYPHPHPYPHPHSHLAAAAQPPAARRVGPLPFSHNSPRLSRVPGGERGGTDRPGGLRCRRPLPPRSTLTRRRRRTGPLPRRGSACPGSPPHRQPPRRPAPAGRRRKNESKVRNTSPFTQPRVMAGPRRRRETPPPAAPGPASPPPPAAGPGYL